MTTTVPTESAADLFGRPPRPATECPQCGWKAEPYRAGRCWACCASTDARLALQTKKADRVAARSA